MEQGYANKKIKKFNILFTLITALFLICLMGCSTTQPKTSRLDKQKAELETAGFKVDYIKK